ncbi:MAG: tripartite tricarboxylate transporter substrate binding protein [Proteobacteria bacterium]|nr:tripartite tricarboxylate transporter substrate binding protein [Pseudomonadota bacterium]
MVDVVRRRLVAASVLGAAGFTPGARAKVDLPGGGVYPDHAVRFVVPLPPGGGADIVARLVAEQLGPRMGGTFVVDNKPGGGTVIGADLVAHAAPDGYTLLLGTATTHAINISLLGKLPYDPVKDFEPVALLAVLPLILVVNPAVLPVNSLQELIDYARKHPGKVNFASTGNGSSIHLAGEMLKMVAGLDMTHVPYKGAAPALTDLLGGQVQFMFTTIPPALPHVKAGKLRALCVANAKRSSILPDLPTTAEAGAPGVEASSWNGVLVPARTPQPIVQALDTQLGAVMQMPDVVATLKLDGTEPAYLPAPEFAAFMARETERYRKVVIASHAHVD